MKFTSSDILEVNFESRSAYPRQLRQKTHIGELGICHVAPDAAAADDDYNDDDDDDYDEGDDVAAYLDIKNIGGGGMRHSTRVMVF